MNSSATVEAELGLRLLVPEHGGVPLTASVYYRSDDPYAIRMAFHVGADEPVEWIFARELLATGMSAQAGGGDVRVWPGEAPDEDVLNITLSSPFGRAHFEAPRSEFAWFLRRTFDLIAPGREAEHIDIEGELNDLLPWA